MPEDYYHEQLRMLRSAGLIEHAKEFEGVVTALRIIRTWASVEGALHAEHVINIADKVLEPLNPTKQKENEQ